MSGSREGLGDPVRPDPSADGLAALPESDLDLIAACE
jgi:hypothetical protein